MAKARVTLICKDCGKEYEVTRIVSNRKEADNWEKYMSNAEGCCPNCYKKAMLEKDTKETGNLPKLTGTEKQVVWATRIRADFVRTYGKYIEISKKVSEEKKEQMKNFVDEKGFEQLSTSQIACYIILFELNTNKSAKFWIDNRIYI